MEGYEIRLTGLPTLEAARELDSKIFAQHEKECQIEIVNEAGEVVPWGADA